MGKITCIDNKFHDFGDELEISSYIIPCKKCFALWDIEEVVSYEKSVKMTPAERFLSLEFLKKDFMGAVSENYDVDFVKQLTPIFDKLLREEEVNTEDMRIAAFFKGLGFGYKISATSEKVIWTIKRKKDDL